MNKKLEKGDNYLMVPGNYFSRRLSKKEFDKWYSLEADEETHMKSLENAFAHFCKSDRSMLFASYVGRELIGISSIFIAKEDNSATIVGLKVDKQHRETSTRQVIRSSLPLFRTDEIQRITALVAQDDTISANRFPLTNFMHSWSRGALDELGFVEIDTVNYCSISNASKTATMDQKKDLKSLQSVYGDLIHKMRESGEHIPSNVWLGLNMPGTSDQTGFHYSIDKENLLLVWNVLEDEIIFPIFLAEPELPVGNFMDLFEINSSEPEVNSFVFPLVAKSQLRMLRGLAEMLDGHLSVSSLSVMRKEL